MIEIDHERRLSIVRLSGPFDPVGVKDVVRALQEHPEYDPTYSALYDVRNVTMDAVTANNLQQLAYDVFDPSWSGTKWAAVATDDDVFGMARVYAAVADGTVDQQRRVFRDYDAALAWLAD